MAMQRSGFLVCGLGLILGATSAAMARGDERGCEFVVPAGAVTEQDPLPGGLPAYLQADDPCEDVLTGIAASGPNAGCTAPAGPQRGFTPLTIGVAMKGDSRGWNGVRDWDWYAVVDQLPVQQTYLIDYTFQSRAPMSLVPWWAGTIFPSNGYADCDIAAGGWLLFQVNPCEPPVSRRTVLRSRSIGLDGQPNDDLLIRVYNTETQGYTCADGQSDYWLRINWVLATSECPPIPDPPGVLGVDYNDERDPNTATTFDGTGGAAGVMYEPCHYAPNGNYTGWQGPFKSGCTNSNWTDGDFIRLTPNVPQIGTVDDTLDGSVRRDVDWYKFELTERSMVSLRVQCGGPMVAVITDNNCGYETEPITHAVAATLGHCGQDPKDFEDRVVLDAGVYIVVVYNTDVYSNGHIVANIDCHPTSGQYGVAKYRVDVNATPAPPCCAGNADHVSGEVNFDDLVAVLTNWLIDYGEGNTGPGDATCDEGDGVVDMGDVTAVLANWMSACP